MPITATPSQTFGAAETVTATKLNTLGAPTIADGQTYGFAAGSAALPGVTFDGDTNTGLYRPASDTVSVSLGGTERSRLAPSDALFLRNQSALLSGTVANADGSASIQFGNNGAASGWDKLVRVSSGASVLDVGPSGVAASSLSAPRVIGSGSVSVAAGSGAGTGASVSLTAGSNGLAGRIDMTTGTSPATGADWCTVTLPAAFPTSAWVSLTGANQEAAAALGSGNVFVKPNISTGTFVLRTGTSAPVGGVQYLFNYVVIGG
jgi:hypothetical protein